MMNLSPNDPETILHQVFGFPNFRGHQREIVEDICAGLDVLAIMPTGAGKSLCYQVPALVRPGCALVISPLIALMQDQVRAMRAFGVRAAALNSQSQDSAATIVALQNGELDLLYVAPERAMTPGFQALISRVEIALIAIDEVHCVSQWGHDFRPEYRQLRALCDMLPGVPRIGLTATADATTRADILDQLGIAPDRMVVAGFDRPNIRYEVAAKVDERQQLANLLYSQSGMSGIIYTQTRSKTDSVASALIARGIHALPYHAGLDGDVRSRNQARFVSDDAVVMVATIAFGMGIDKPDVRFVAHLGLPKSIEAYYQETGRAGRDGDPAVAHLIYGPDDIARQRSFIESSEASIERKRFEQLRLGALIGFAETSKCRRIDLLRYFGEDVSAPCGNCDNCLNPPDIKDARIGAQMLLSAVQRTGQMFGLTHLIDVLRGSRAERIAKLRHDKLSVYGIGKSVEKPEWEAVSRHLIAAEALARNEHGGLVFGPNARTYLRGEVAVEVRAISALPNGRGRTTTPAPRLANGDEPLFNALRNVRRELASAAGMPPYVIFHDTTLRAMAVERPQTIEELGKISGVGARKLDNYGAVFLRVLRDESRLYSA